MIKTAKQTQASPRTPSKKAATGEPKRPLFQVTEMIRTMLFQTLCKAGFYRPSGRTKGYRFAGEYFRELEQTKRKRDLQSKKLKKATPAGRYSILNTSRGTGTPAISPAPPFFCASSPHPFLCVTRR